MKTLVLRFVPTLVLLGFLVVIIPFVLKKTGIIPTAQFYSKPVAQKTLAGSIKRVKVPPGKLVYEKVLDYQCERILTNPNSSKKSDTSCYYAALKLYQPTRVGKFYTKQDIRKLLSAEFTNNQNRIFTTALTSPNIERNPVTQSRFQILTSRESFGSNPKKQIYGVIQRVPYWHCLDKSLLLQCPKPPAPVVGPDIFPNQPLEKIKVPEKVLKRAEKQEKEEALKPIPIRIYKR